MDFWLRFRIIIDFLCCKIPWCLLYPTPRKVVASHKSTSRRINQANFCADHSFSSETQSDIMIDETQLLAFDAMTVWETEMLRVNDSNNWPFAKPEGVLLVICKMKAQVQRGWAVTTGGYWLGFEIEKWRGRSCEGGIMPFIMLILPLTQLTQV